MARTFDVPARTAFAQRFALPENVAVLRHARLPKRKVGDGFLGVFVALDPFARAHFVEVELEQLAVVAAAAAVFLDAEINRAVGGFVGDAARDEFFDERNDVGDVVGGVRRVVGQKTIQRFQVLEKRGLVLAGEFAE